MSETSRHHERESLAAAIKGLSLDEHLRRKQSTAKRDPEDDFAAWHERFRHELTSEFGELSDDADEESVNDYIRSMKKQFRLRLK